jgi:hypothetical protein
VDDDAGTGRWMTYDELAEVRGIKRIGAVRLVQRYKWRRQAGNDGRARVLVPHDALQPVRGTDAGTNAPIHVTPTSAGSAAGNDAGTMLEGALAALEDAVAALREQLDVANARAERAESAITTERAKSDALRQQLVRADARSDELRTEAAALHERVEALQAGQDMMLDMHARALAAAQSDLDMARAQATTAHDALKAVRQAQADRKGRGLLARLRAAWRGE